MSTFRIADLVGEWVGNNQLRVSPGDPVRESRSTAHIRLEAEGRFATLRYTWSDGERPQEGLLLIGATAGLNPVDVVWVDSWHMRDALMQCSNEPGDDAILDARGTYAAPPGPDWGWRIKIRPESADAFRMLMFNISPEGEEELAVEAVYERR